MAYLVAKVLLALLIVSNVSALEAHDQSGAPNDGLGIYKDQSCCPDGYFVAG